MNDEEWKEVSYMKEKASSEDQEIQKKREKRTKETDKPLQSSITKTK